MKSLFHLYHLSHRFTRAAYTAENVLTANCARVSLYYSSYVHCAPALYCIKQCGLAIQHLSTSATKILPREVPSRETLLKKLEIALKDDNMQEALEAFSNYKKLHGLPEPRLLNSMIISLSYASSRGWLQRAYDLILSVYQQNSNLLNCSSLSRLALTLARNQMPVPASTVLRIILQSGKFPSIDILNVIILHMVRTEVGSYLATDILVETCDLFWRQISDRRKLRKLDLINNNVTLFNIVLDSCVRFKCIIKAQKIMELISLVRVTADVNSVVIISRVFEMIGQRDELTNLKECIDSISSTPLIQHYQQFYDSLLSLHFNFNDMDAAANLIIDLYRGPNYAHSFNKGSHKQSVVQIGSSNLKMGYKIMFDPAKLGEGFIVDTQSQSGLVLVVDGKFIPSEKALAKLIAGCVKVRKVGIFSNFLVRLYKEDLHDTLCADVINVCIQMGWFDAAHDIIDDLELAGVHLRIDTYISLLRAYQKEIKSEEFNVLLKQMEKNGLFVTDIHSASSCDLKDVACTVIDETSATKSTLLEILAKEVRQDNPRDNLVYELNNSILFFSKAKMMEDALKTYKRMRERKVRPTLLTFCHILCGYSALHMYRETTILWGEIKRELEDGVLTVDRDLLDCLLLNFLKGGYFARIMEVIDYMSKHNIYCDKWKYKHMFLKLHKNLYRNLNASSHVKTDAQSKRLEHVQAFRLWAGIK